MAVELEFISLIIPIEKIEKYYPGGFKKYKSDNTQSIGRRIWYDNYVVRDGAMSPMDIEYLVKQWEGFGLVAIIEENGNKQWKDLCVVDFFGGITLPCLWLRHKDNFVYHEKDESQIIINRDNVSDMSIHSFSPVEWLNKFRTASQNKLGFSELRAEIFQQTVKVVQRGKYECGGKLVKFDITEVIKETYFYKKPNLLDNSKPVNRMRFNVVDADCIETAELLKNAGYNVCLLNMANRQNPGGGVLGGAGAQEENIFRRSNLFLSLYQFVDYSNQYDIERNFENSYPLDRNSGGIYSKKVTIFRGSEKNGYCFLQNPFEISVVSVPAINRPQLEFINGQYYITKDLIEPSKEKIRTILRICGEFNHDCLVLSAFGCGAFRNPPNHMAKLFKDVFNEPEFYGRFKLIVFAIIDDHNAWKEHNPEGNILPFLREFNNNFA
ncbi:MAG TPA: TIGR02452 family protein [Bacteroidales bacterium]|nr:TIGR02452 family protein [Bacteroidales bacterium]